MFFINTCFRLSIGWICWFVDKSSVGCIVEYPIKKFGRINEYSSAKRLAASFNIALSTAVSCFRSTNIKADQRRLSVLVASDWKRFNISNNERSFDVVYCSINVWESSVSITVLIRDLQRRSNVQVQSRNNE